MKRRVLIDVALLAWLAFASVLYLRQMTQPALVFLHGLLDYP